MAGTVSKLRLVARCAVISIPKDVREAAGWDIGQQVVCEAVKLERGDVRVVISEASEEEMRTAPQAGRGSHTATRRTVTADTPLFDLAAQHRAKNTGTKRTKSGKVSFARRAQVHDGGERRVKAPRVRMQGERRASKATKPDRGLISMRSASKPVARKGKAAKTQRAAARHTAKRVVAAKARAKRPVKRAAKRAVKRTAKRARA
jgi:bifunctional DNA-binding transcriptional regulator/antitoxin component of YhaV-PrlF toxin-antitoxin module